MLENMERNFLQFLWVFVMEYMENRGRNIDPKKLA